MGGVTLLVGGGLLGPDGGREGRWGRLGWRRCRRWRLSGGGRWRHGQLRRRATHREARRPGDETTLGLHHALESAELAHQGLGELLEAALESQILQSRLLGFHPALALGHRGDALLHVLGQARPLIKNLIEARASLSLLRE